MKIYQPYGEVTEFYRGESKTCYLGYYMKKDKALEVGLKKKTEIEKNWDCVFELHIKEIKVIE